MHLVFNMLALWMLGPSVEKAIGMRRYVVFSVLCAVASMAGFLLLNRDPAGVVMGYSGVIFGILAAQAILFPNSRIAMFAFFPLSFGMANIRPFLPLMGHPPAYITTRPCGEGFRQVAELALRARGS